MAKDEVGQQRLAREDMGQPKHFEKAVAKAAEQVPEVQRENAQQEKDLEEIEARQDRFSIATPTDTPMQPTSLERTGTKRTLMTSLTRTIQGGYDEWMIGWSGSSENIGESAAKAVRTSSPTKSGVQRTLAFDDNVNDETMGHDTATGNEKHASGSGDGQMLGHGDVS